MKEQGLKEYKLFNINPQVESKINKTKNILFFVNLPIIVGLPILLETGMLAMSAEKLEKLYGLLCLGDFFLTFNSILFYSFVKSMAKSITYDVEENKIKVRHYGTNFLKETESSYNPDELVKHRRKSINLFVGYKSIKTGDTK